MKKALMYASVASMIQQFNMNNILLLQELGYEVDVACNFEFGSTISKEKINQLKDTLDQMNVSYYHIPIPRRILDYKSLKQAYKQTKQLFNDKEYDLIHCHSPIGGLICRIANKNSNHYNDTKMIYTAHGFHFFKGNNPLKNFLFRNIERYTAKYTDVLITINKEDYEAAKKFKLKENGKIEYVPGVGIDIDKINYISGNREGLINELHIPRDSILLLSVGELNENKNHRVVIEALPGLPDNVQYLICGVGTLKDKYIELSKTLKVEKRLHLLGYRDNVIEIMKSIDIFVFPSKREGLSVALMEAMACDLPCVASNIRGNRDLIENAINGYVINIDEFSNQLIKVLLDKEMSKQEIYKVNILKSENYNIKNILFQMRQIYELKENI